MALRKWLSGSVVRIEFCAGASDDDSSYHNAHHDAGYTPTTASDDDHTREYD